MRNVNVRLALAVIAGMAFLPATTIVQAQSDSARLDIRTARDVAVSPSGTLWIVGAGSTPNGSVQRLVGSALVTQPGSAVRVAVEPSGNAWIVNSSGDLYHWEKTPARSQAWVLASLKAMDVAVGASGAVWAVGTDHRILGFQNGTWTALSGGGDRIAVDPLGYPWVTNSNNEIWHWIGTGWISVPGKAQDIAVSPDNTVFIVGMTPKPGGFQIQKQTGNTWTDVPGAVGVAIAATPHVLTLAQLPPSAQVVTLNAVPVITQPVVIANSVPVINAPPTTILLNGTTSIPVSPPSGTASPASGSTSPAPSPSDKIRKIFFRDQGYEVQMLQAIKFGGWKDRIFLDGQYPPASSLPPLERAFAHLAMTATEAYYRNQPQTTPRQALDQIGSISNPSTRRTINTVLGAMVVAKMYDRSTDPETLALRDWATQLWRLQKTAAAKSTLDEYGRWKQDPCGYEGKQRGECMTMANLFTTRTPPENLFASKTLNTMFAQNAGEIGATAALLAGGLGVTVSTAVLASTLGLEAVAADFVANTPAVFTSLLNTFGGMTANSAGAVSTLGAASIGGAVVSAAIMAVVVGTTEGFKVVNAMRVEPMLMAQVGSAMSQPIVIENDLNSDAAKQFFYLAFENAAINRFALPPNTVDGQIRFYNQGGYVARMRASYNLKGEMNTVMTPDLAVGAEATLVIPAAAKGISVNADWSDMGITWRPFYAAALPAPTYLGYTSYGTVFSPQVKVGYPEISNIQGTLKTLTVTQGGGYVAQVHMSYMQGGKTITVFHDTGVTAGWRKEFTIPADATNIYLEIFSHTGLIDPAMKAAFIKTWPSPPNECVKVYGTTLDPRWNSECN